MLLMVSECLGSEGFTCHTQHKHVSVILSYYDTTCLLRHVWILQDRVYRTQSSRRLLFEKMAILLQMAPGDVSIPSFRAVSSELCPQQTRPAGGPGPGGRPGSGLVLSRQVHSCRTCLPVVTFR